ncbi:hypothetical protein VIGAN_06116200, partial [Vigna angularis var. angularis]
SVLSLLCYTSPSSVPSILLHLFRSPPFSSISFVLLLSPLFFLLRSPPLSFILIVIVLVRSSRWLGEGVVRRLKLFGI